MMLYTKYESSGPCSFRQVDFCKFHFKTFFFSFFSFLSFYFFESQYNNSNRSNIHFIIIHRSRNNDLYRNAKIKMADFQSFLRRKVIDSQVKSTGLFCNSRPPAHNTS